MLKRWSYRTGITEYEYSIFQEAVGDNIHNYHPISVSHNGDLRYRFIVNTVISPKFPTDFFVLEIYKPRGGKAYITRKIPIDTDV